jgi:hypothetical protein
MDLNLSTKISIIFIDDAQLLVEFIVNTYED